MSEPTPLRPTANENIETAEAPAKAAAAPAPEQGPPAQKPRSNTRRRVLFALLPVALVIGGYVYVTGGQEVSTDNAYIAANIVGVSTDVAGTVQSVEVHENQTVKAGDVLFRLKPETFQIALEGAEAKLESARNDLLTLQASYRQAQAEIAQAKADLPYYQSAFDRQQKLVSMNTASHAEFDQAKHNLDAAKQKVIVAEAQAAEMLAKLGGDADRPVEENPVYLQAKAAVDDAKRQLDDTVVRAPFDGIATNVSAVQVGSYLDAAQAAFSLVSTENMWIAANPKETQLTYVKSGQPVTISVDAYPGVEWTGKVASVSPASESSFSLLPAQNSSGNWVKVVQRIPMRITIDDTKGKPPLRAGMSTEIDIDTGHARGLPQFVDNLLGKRPAYAHE
jgi:membrane fusion protein, multidrug efflux system